jgi:hypothetical protein
MPLRQEYKENTLGLSSSKGLFFSVVRKMKSFQSKPVKPLFLMNYYLQQNIG